MAQTPTSGVEGLTTLGAVDRILAFNAKAHDASVSSGGRARARALRDAGLALVDDWKGDSKRRKLHEQLIMAVDFTDRHFEGVARRAAIERGESVEIPGRFFPWLARTPELSDENPVTREVELLNRDEFSVRLQNVDGRPQATAIRQLEGDQVEEFPVVPRFDLMMRDTGEGIGRPARPLTREQLEESPAFGELNFLRGTGELASTALRTSNAIAGSFGISGDNDAELVMGHELGRAPYGDTPNLVENGRVISKADREGGTLSKLGRMLNPRPSLMVPDELADLPAAVEDVGILRSNDILFGRKQFDADGKPFVLDRAGQQVQLYEPFAIGSEINLPDGTSVRLTEEKLEGIVRAKAGGRLGQGIVSALWHDDVAETPFGEILVPKITGNADTDRELLSDPVYLRGVMESRHAGTEFWTAVQQSGVHVAEFVATMGLLKAGGKLVGGAARAGIASTAGRRYVAPLLTRFSGQGVGGFYGKVLQTQAKALQGGSRAGRVTAPFLHGDMLQIGEDVLFETIVAGVRGEDLGAGAIAGLQEGVSVHLFSKAARATRRAAGPLMRKMSERLGGTGDAAAFLSAGLSDEFAQGMAARATQKLQRVRGKITENLARGFADREVAQSIGTLRMQASAEALADSVLLGYLFGSYGEGQRLAAQEGRNWNKLDPLEKAGYISDGLGSPAAAGTALSFATYQAGFSALNMIGAPQRGLPQVALDRIETMVDNVVTNNVRDGLSADPEIAHAIDPLVRPSFEETLAELGDLKPSEFLAELSGRAAAVQGHPDALFNEVGGDLTAQHVGEVYLKDGGPELVAAAVERLPDGALRRFRREVRELPIDVGEELNRINVGRHLDEIVSGVLRRRSTESEADRRLQEAADLADQTYRQAGTLEDDRGRPQDPVEIDSSEVPSYFLRVRQQQSPDGQMVRFHPMRARNLAVVELEGGRFGVVGRKSWRPISGSPENGFGSLLEAQAWALQKGRVADSDLARMAAAVSADPSRPEARYGEPDTSSVDAQRAEDLSRAILQSMRMKRESYESAAEAEAKLLREETDDVDFVAPSKITAPETRGAIDAQMKAMRDGRKPAVLITPGSPVPKIRGREERKVKLPEGTLILPSAGSKNVLRALRRGDVTLGDVLGYGAEQGQTDQVVSAFDADGNVVADIQAEPVPAVLEAARKLAGEDGSVFVRSVDDVLQERRQGDEIVTPDQQSDQLPFGAGLETPKPETIQRARADVFEALRTVPGNELADPATLVDGWLLPKHYASSKALRSRVRDARNHAESQRRKAEARRAKQRPKLSKPRQTADQAIGEAGQTASETSPERARLHREVETELAVEQAADEAQGRVQELEAQREAAGSALFQGTENEAAFRAGADMLVGVGSTAGRRGDGGLASLREAADYILRKQLQKQSLRSFAAGLIYRLGTPEGSQGKSRLDAVAKITGLTSAEVEAVRDQLLQDGAALSEVEGPRREALEALLGSSIDKPATQRLLRQIALAPPLTSTQTGRSRIPSAKRVREALDQHFSIGLEPIARELGIDPARLLTTLRAEGGLIERFAEGVASMPAEVKDFRQQLLRRIGRNFGFKNPPGNTEVPQLGGKRLADITENAIAMLTGQDSVFHSGDVFQEGSVVRASVLEGSGPSSLESIAVAGDQSALGRGITTQDAVAAVRADRSARAGGGRLRPEDVQAYNRAAAGARDALSGLAQLHVFRNGVVDPLLNDLDLPPGRLMVEGFLDSERAPVFLRRAATDDPKLRALFEIAVDRAGQRLYTDETAASRAFDQVRDAARESIQASQELAERLAERSDLGDGGQATAEALEAFFRAREAAAFGRPMDADVRAILQEGDPIIFPHGAIDPDTGQLAYGSLKRASTWIHEAIRDASEELEAAAPGEPVLLYSGIPTWAAQAFDAHPSTLDPVTGDGVFSLRLMAGKLRQLPVVQRFVKSPDEWKSRPAKALAKAGGKLMAQWAEKLGRGQNALGLPKQVRQANLDLRRIQIDQRAQAARVFQIMGKALDKIRVGQLSPNAQLFIAKAIDSKAYLRFANNGEWERAFGKEVLPLVDVLNDVVQVFNEAGRRMVEEGLLEPGQFRKSMYVPKMLRGGGEYEQAIRSAMEKGQSPVSSRELPRKKSDVAETVESVLLLDESMPRAVIQETQRTQFMGTLRHLAESEHVLSAAEYEKLGPYERAFWVKAAEPTGGLQALGESRTAYRDRMLTVEEKKALAAGELAPQEAEAIIRRRGKARPQQARLWLFLEAERRSMQDERVPNTEQKNNVVDRLMDGYITRNALFELDLLMDTADPTATGAGFLQAASDFWRRQRTVQSATHWSLNVYGSVMSNWATGRIGAGDFIRSVFTGKGNYATSANHVAAWWKWDEAGRPPIEELDVRDQEAIRLMEEFRDLLGPSTFGNLMNDPVNPAELMEAYAQIDPSEVHGSQRQKAALGDAVGTMMVRRLPWQMRFDEAVSKGSGDPNPRGRAEANRALDGAYEVHEIFYKYAAFLNALEAGMTKQAAVEWAAKGTADYADRNPLIYKMTSRYNMALSLSEEAATRMVGTRGLMGFGAKGNNAVRARRLRRGVGKLVAGPFWNYAWQMVPTMIESVATNPATMIGSFMGLSAILNAVLTNPIEQEELEEALSGKRDYLKINLTPEAERYLEETYKDAKVGGFINGSHPVENRISYPALVRLRRMWRENFEQIPGPERGGRSTVIDAGDAFFGQRLVRDIKREGLVSAVAENVNLAFLPAAAIATSGQVADVGRAFFSEDRTELERALVDAVAGLAKETNSFLGGGVGGAILSGQGQKLLRDLSDDGRTLSEQMRGIRRPLLEDAPLSDRAKLAISGLLLPMRDVPGGTAFTDPDNLTPLEKLSGTPWEDLIRPSGVKQGAEESVKLRNFNKALPSQLADLATDAYIKLLDGEDLGDYSVTGSAMLRRWLDVSIDAVRDPQDGQMALRRNVQTEIGKFIRHHSGDDVLLEKAMVGRTLDALEQWSGSGGFALETLVNKRRIDPSIVRRASRALFTDRDEGRAMLEFLRRRVIEQKDTENAGVYYQLYKLSGLQRRSFENSAQAITQRRLDEAFHGMGAGLDLDFQVPQDRARAQKVLGPAAPDVAPDLYLQEFLSPRKKK